MTEEQESKKQKRCVVLEEQVLYRQLVINLLRTRHNYEPAGEASNGLDGLRLCREVRPQLLVVNIALPGLNGVELMQQLKPMELKINVIVLMDSHETDAIAELVRLGVQGVLHLRQELPELSHTIEQVEAGKLYVNSAPCGKRGPAGKTRERRALEALPPREREVLALVARGLPTKQIADDLGISVKTVEAYRSSLHRRLGINDIAGLAVFAVKVGLVDLDDELLGQPVQPGTETPVA